MGPHVITVRLPLSEHALLSTGLKPRYVELRIYDSAKQVRAAAKRWAPHEAFAGAIAVCQGLVKADDDSMVAVVRVARDVSIEVLSHELVHAGFAVWREQHNQRATFGSVVGPREEGLAHVVGDLVACAVWKLQTLGIWGTGEAA